MAELLLVAIGAWSEDPPRFVAALDALVEQLSAAVTAAEHQLAVGIDQLWQHGWSPSDVVHVVTRDLTAGHAQVAAEQIVADAQRRRDRGQSLHPRWLEELEAVQETATSGLPLPTERLEQMVEVLGLVARLPSVPSTVPAPGQAGNGPLGGAAHLDARMLKRVQALLAKAESTTFEDEAEAFTAKAQELIARHAIDEALLHTVDDVGEPSTRRILIDDPYADAKANLLAAVAYANRCRTVYSGHLGWITAFGYDHDLNAVELLSASLLAQATGAMVRHGSRRDAAGRSRTRSFRRAFLLGFAQRIGERLRQATAEQMAATDDRAGQLVPVLAARDDRVREAQEAAFPESEEWSVSASNATGWWAGHAAAEQANLQVSPHHLPES